MRKNTITSLHFLYILWWRIWRNFCAQCITRCLWMPIPFTFFDNFILLFYLLCCWKLPDPLCAGQHCCCCHLIVMFMCSAMAFTSCQPCRKSVPISITVIAFLIDTFGNWLTFKGRSGTDKLVTEPTFTLNHLRVSSYGPGRKNELID